jgi:MFS family permease
MNQIKDKIGSALGCILEWYDFALFGFFAGIIGELYFPNSTSLIRLLKVFLVFSVGFFARPLGALIFGYISDKYGRSVSLKLTPVLITLPTFLLSCLPTYRQIGFLAPLILLLIRILQGVCVGGEFANCIIYLCEIGFIAYWIRRDIQETPVHLNLIELNKIAHNPIYNSYKNNKKIFLMGRRLLSKRHYSYCQNLSVQ